jgi:hypothetical protein
MGMDRLRGKEMKYLLGIYAISILVVCHAGAGSVPQIHVAPGVFKDYFHIEFELTPENCELTVPVSERLSIYGGSNEYEFAAGGQFEVFIRKDAFPVPAPHTNADFLILRMPYTDPSAPDAELLIESKYSLFNRIKRMKEDGVGAVTVVIELNPYMTVLNTDPLMVELSGRNIFFRQAHGRYIDFVGPLYWGNPE